LRKAALALAAGALAAWPQGATGALELGVTTHFSQGWPPRYWDIVGQEKIGAIRDSLHWRAIETTPGSYRFTAANSQHIQRACDAGVRVLLGIDPRNPLYDSGQTAFSTAAKAAFARYISAIADRFGDCIVAVEIGNEINAQANMTGRAAVARPLSHAALLKTVHGLVKPKHPGLQILGGSVNSVATGFLIRLFDAGALPYLDGVVVHPYRQDPANLDWELARLAAAMRQRGAEKPIWVTEFSRDFAAPSDAAPFLAKAVTLMSAAGIEHAYWYALVDQNGFPTMGLYTAAGGPKPAARAYAFMARELLARGQAVRVGGDDHTLFRYRFGADRQILWGSRRSFATSAPAVFRNAQGEIIPKPREIGDEPVIVEGAVSIRPGPPRVIADSLYGYGRAPWSYFARRGGAAPLPLVPIDWNWTSFIGHPTLKPIVVNQLGLAPGGNAVVPVPVTVRYTATRRGMAHASACIARPAANGDGVTLRILHNGRPLGAAELVTGEHRVTRPVDMAVADTIDFEVGPNRTALADQVRYRFRIATTAEDGATC
jgi:hypothetical protein